MEGSEGLRGLDLALGHRDLRGVLPDEGGEVLGDLAVADAVEPPDELDDVSTAVASGEAALMRSCA